MMMEEDQKSITRLHLFLSLLLNGTLVMKAMKCEGDGSQERITK
jgi:hypothetical protein